jgi:hypothetical protein
VGISTAGWDLYQKVDRVRTALAVDGKRMKEELSVM